MNPQSRFRLYGPAKSSLQSLIEVVMPRSGMFTWDLREEMYASVEQTLPFLPFLLKMTFPVGLLLLEYAPLLFIGKFQTFSSLSLDEKERYINKWIHHPFFLFREMIKGIKALAVMAYFDNPQVTKALGFMQPEYVEELGLKRLNRYGREISQIQKSTS